ncbi:MAG: hypothetical protein JNN22_03340 [Rhodospirillales bacterium]|nr:hypothetical protein [Rhodospirillales bacterium]
MKMLVAVLAVIAVAFAGTPAFAQKAPERSNKAGEIRGKDRAAQVKEMNEKNKADKKSKAAEKSQTGGKKN